MSSKSRKSKGTRFERFLVDIFRETLDGDTHRQPGSGSGLDKNDVRIPVFNTEIEAKNQSTIHLIKDWEQTKSQQTTGNKAFLAIRNPKKPEFEETLIVMELNDLIELMKKTTGEVNVISNKDNNLLYWSKMLKETCRKVIKELDKK